MLAASLDAHDEGARQYSLTTRSSLHLRMKNLQLVQGTVQYNEYSGNNHDDDSLVDADACADYS